MEVKLVDTDDKNFKEYEAKMYDEIEIDNKLNESEKKQIAEKRQKFFEDAKYVIDTVIDPENHVDVYQDGLESTCYILVCGDKVYLADTVDETTILYDQNFTKYNEDLFGPNWTEKSKTRYQLIQKDVIISAYLPTLNSRTITGFARTILKKHSCELEVTMGNEKTTMVVYRELNWINKRVMNTMPFRREAYLDEHGNKRVKYIPLHHIDEEE
jgi:hypothetical protein